MPQKNKIRLPRNLESRRVICEALAGYRRMNEFTEEELRRELPKMTEDDSRKIFEELYAAWQQTRQYYPDPRGDAILDQQHIQEFVEQRRLWNKIGCELAKQR
jgi:hypothetical protein